MSKRIVYCSDGTWQTPVSNTNVYRLYKALTLSSDQVTYYDDGVGADATRIGPDRPGCFRRGPATEGPGRLHEDRARI